MSLSNHISVRAPAQERRLYLRRLRFDESARQAAPVWIPVAVAAAVLVALATWSLATSSYGLEDFAGIAVLFAAAAIAEAIPVPIEGVAVGGTSLATIFLVSIAVSYGWDAATVAGFLTMALVEVARRRPFSRIAFNCGVYAMGGVAAGAAAEIFARDTLWQLVLGAIAASLAFYLVDIILLSAVVARTRRMRIRSSLRNYVYLTLVPFAIMASLAVILVVLWDRSPFVAVVLVGPLLATALYQRWIHGALDRLREFDRLKDEFIAIVSHELRTPLTSVYGAAMTLRGQSLDERRRNVLLDIVATEAARLGRLLDDILWVSRLDTGRAENVVTRVDPVALAGDVVRAKRAHLPDDVSIELRYDPETQAVAADPDKVRQVLVNLVENAVKYGGTGKIEVIIAPQYGTTRFCVRDYGPGIPLEEHERIFDKFYRLDPNMTKGVGGTGLGLYICRELVESMGGQIWVDSRLDEGATFIFELPLYSD